eukprot:SAG22_NODE_2_length_61565_cov_858.782010_8_plen_69_part_00
MKFQKKKDIKRRKAYLKYESKRIFSKYLLAQTLVPSGPSSMDDVEQSINHDESMMDDNLMQVSALSAL